MNNQDKDCDFRTRWWIDRQPHPTRRNQEIY